MARIPLSDKSIRELLDKAASQADVTLSNVGIEYVLPYQLLVTFTITCELGSESVAVSGVYFLDNRDELQDVLNQSMAHWITPNAN